MGFVYYKKFYLTKIFNLKHILLDDFEILSKYFGMYFMYLLYIYIYIYINNALFKTIAL